MPVAVDAVEKVPNKEKNSAKVTKEPAKSKEKAPKKPAAPKGTSPFALKIRLAPNSNAGPKPKKAAKVSKSTTTMVANSTKPPVMLHPPLSSISGALSLPFRDGSDFLYDALSQRANSNSSPPPSPEVTFFAGEVPMAVDWKLGLSDVSTPSPLDYSM